MKLFLLNVLVFGIVASVSAQIFGRGEPPRGHGQMPQQNSEQARRAQEMIGKCQRQELATETDMTEFAQQRRPSTKTGKCLHACLMESVGLVSNGKLSVEKSVEFMSQMAQGNYELIKIIKEIAKECETVNDPDRCELALKIMECNEAGIRKRENELKKFAPRQHQQQDSKYQ